ncbi:MAG: hypothetical protein ACJZ5P_00890 [Candidatus Thalassarchaeaceae archaeon]|nr:hypothetical protein [Candidatus Thalassarchaeaceae archaeon]
MRKAESNWPELAISDLSGTGSDSRVILQRAVWGRLSTSSPQVTEVFIGGT